MKNYNKGMRYMVAASIVLLFIFLFPIWRITLIAPQYPDGVTLYIWVYKLTGEDPGTIQNINILNHYVGMDFIEPESIPELKYFPYVIGFMSVLGLLFAWWRKSVLYLIWGCLMSILSLIGIYDFYLWEYDYGHNLSTDAPIKVPGMVYQPPLIGSKYLLNFLAESYPSWGTLFLMISIVLSFLAYFYSKKKFSI